MNARKNTALLAAFVYLVVIITGMFSMAYVPDKLVDENNWQSTFENIKAYRFLFKLGIYTSVICYVAFIFLPLILYKLLKTVDSSYAKAMVILALLGVPVSFNSIQFKFDILRLTGGNHSVHQAPLIDLQNRLMFSFQQYNYGLMLASVFWGLWLYPFGSLVYRSRFMPKFLGVLLILGCLGYLINFTGRTFVENYADTNVGNYISLLPAVAELSICFWLFYYGLKKQRNGQ